MALKKGPDMLTWILLLGWVVSIGVPSALVALWLVVMANLWGLGRGQTGTYWFGVTVVLSALITYLNSRSSR